MKHVKIPSDVDGNTPEFKSGMCLISPKRNKVKVSNEYEQKVKKKSAKNRSWDENYTKQIHKTIV